MSIRTAESEIQMKLVEALGGNPVPIPWSELYTALATGVVEGSKNGITDIVNFSMSDFEKYLTLDGHTYQDAYFWMNNDFYMSLPDDLKDIVNDGAYHMAEVSRFTPMFTQVEAFEKFKEAGGTVYLPTPPEERQTFVEASKPVERRLCPPTATIG